MRSARQWVARRRPARAGSPILTGLAGDLSLRQVLFGAAKLPVGQSVMVTDSGSTAPTMGLSVNVPLLSPDGLPATKTARHRAAAARMQRDDALDDQFAHQQAA